MATLGVVAAARAAGVSRATINRYLKAGKLSCNGQRQIDTAELLRVFGPLQPAATTAATTDTVAVIPSQQPRAQAPDTTALLAELRRQIDRLEADKAELRRDLDAERDERRRLVGIIERAQITDQRAAPAPTPRQPRRRPTPTPAPAAPTIADLLVSWLRGGR